MGKLVIFDFDGTLTDAEREGAPFRGGYLEDVATLTGWPLSRVAEAARRVEDEIAARPEAYGWLFEGQIVAPASVDPYLRMMPVARRLLDEAEALLNPTDRERVLDGLLYKYNYQKTTHCFREGAAECLQALLRAQEEGALSLRVVTNSHTDAVQAKIRRLEEERAAAGGGGPSLTPLVARVHGRAKKYALDDALTEVPRALTLPGLDRPVLLRRRHYHEALNALRAEAGAAWGDVWVFGDIFELDLSLPLALGARVGLMANAFTPAWERDFLRAHPRGHVLSALSEAAALALAPESR
ncbi:MAG: HAD family hydrolase [Deltaproteobacteria bacterium]|nr:HAD family hydrolase [Deltaproteobacteria bacterium]